MSSAIETTGKTVYSASPLYFDLPPDPMVIIHYILAYPPPPLVDNVIYEQPLNFEFTTPFTLVFRYILTHPYPPYPMVITCHFLVTLSTLN